LTNFSIDNCSTCLNITKTGKVIQNTSIKDCYVSKFMVIIKESLMYQKIPI
jgi:hypothetical protein